MSIGKVLINLETKLARLENVNKKLVEAYEQADDNNNAEQFQITLLDNESEFVDDIITKIYVMMNTGNQVLMHIATAMVKSTTNDSSKSTRMILDSGS